MLYKPLVALFMAFTATGGVAASTTPVRRGGSYPPPPGPTIPAGNCNTDTKLYCCDSLTSASNPVVGLLGLVGVGPNTLAGLNCVGLGALSDNPTCDASSVCCNDTHQTGLINVGCTRVSL